MHIVKRNFPILDGLAASCLQLASNIQVINNLHVISAKNNNLPVSAIESSIKIRFSHINVLNGWLD